jgi:hypothetical protein
MWYPWELELACEPGVADLTGRDVRVEALDSFLGSEDAGFDGALVDDLLGPQLGGAEGGLDLHKNGALRAGDDVDL